VLCIRLSPRNGPRRLYFEIWSSRKHTPNSRKNGHPHPFLKTVKFDEGPTLSRCEPLLAISSQTLLSKRSKLFRTAELSLARLPRRELLLALTSSMQLFEVVQRRIALK
jgi:hypothetical protein